MFPSRACSIAWQHYVSEHRNGIQFIFIVLHKNSLCIWDST